MVTVLCLSDVTALRGSKIRDKPSTHPPGIERLQTRLCSSRQLLRNHYSAQQQPSTRRISHYGITKRRTARTTNTILPPRQEKEDLPPPRRRHRHATRCIPLAIPTVHTLRPTTIRPCLRHSRRTDLCIRCSPHPQRPQTPSRRCSFSHGLSSSRRAQPREQRAEPRPARWERGRKHCCGRHHEAFRASDRAGGGVGQ
jgi:hypothetical protein